MRLGDLGELTSRSEYSYVSRIWFDAFENEVAHQGGYSLWNAIFTFKPDNCDLIFQAYVRNITDKGYRTGGFPTNYLFNSQGTWGTPRTLAAK
jgi:outer membrane receptor protein involved in Fe transport